MVKVRESEPLVDGSVDLDLWLKRLQQDVELRAPERIRQACDLALRASERDAHQGVAEALPDQTLLTGLEMADILSQLKLDQPTLEAAILYRSVRRGLLSLESVAKQMGGEVAKLIEGVLSMAAISQLQAPKHGLSQHNQQDNLRKMLVTMVDDVRVALIKIAERTCMLRQVKDASREKRLRVAREVFDIYAPLAHRLGIGQIKWELEDLAFRYLHETEYKSIAKQLAEKRLDRDRYIQDVVHTLETLLERQGILRYHLDGRAKHIYSIWRKMQRKRIDFSQVYDVRAVRILVLDEADKLLSPECRPLWSSCSS